MSPVSVIVPTYNRAALLRPTLRAILAQTAAPDEVIVVDDGSTDDTSDVCASFGSAVRYVRQENAGVSAARNHGMRLAAGELLAFCDSDDLWHPAKLEVQRAVMEDAAVAWCISGCRVVRGDSVVAGTASQGFEFVFPVFGDVGRAPDAHFAHWLRGISLDVVGRTVRGYVGDAYGMLFEGNVVLPSSVLATRDALARAGRFDERFRAAEDTEYFHRVAAQSPVAILMESLVDYRVGHPSLVSTTDAVQLIEVALESLGRAAALRELGEAEARARSNGRRRLLSRLAYTQLTALDGAAARRAVLAARDEGRLGPRDVAVLAASYLPADLLQIAHRMKRALRERRA